MKSPVQDKVRTYVAGLAREARSSGNLLLPTCKEIAAATRSAYVTAWKAVSQLKREGVIAGRQGSRLIALDSGRESDNDVPVPETARRWKGVARRIQDDIENGRFSSRDFLPSIKQLSTMFDASDRTIAKALRFLGTEGMLESSPRGFRLNNRAYRHSGRRSCIELVTWTRNASFPVRSRFSRDSEVYHAFEYICRSMGIALLLRSAEEILDQGVPVVPSSSGHQVLGCVIWCRGGSPVQYREIIAGFTPGADPLVILDETAEVRTSEGAFAEIAGRCAIFPLGTTLDCGIDMGRFLRMKGHRRIAVISPIRNSSRFARIEGLKRVFKDDGMVEEFYLDEFLGKTGIEGALTFQTQADVDSFSDQLERVRRTISGDAVVDAHFQSALESNRELILEQVSQIVYADRLVPLLEKIASNPEITAWVGINDATALAALRFLKSRNRSVPLSVAVVGFDDTIEARTCGLTTYNFDPQRIVQAMVTHLTSAYKPVVKRVHQFVVPGFVVDRMTA